MGFGSASRGSDSSSSPTSSKASDMQPSERWPVLGDLCRTAKKIGSLELRLFGSALHSTSRRDLDVLVLYDDPLKLNALVEADIWELYAPPIDLIGMTHDEDFELEFTAGTGAIPLF